MVSELAFVGDISRAHAVFVRESGLGEAGTALVQSAVPLGENLSWRASSGRSFDGGTAL